MGVNATCRLILRGYVKPLGSEEYYSCKSSIREIAEKLVIGSGFCFPSLLCRPYLHRRRLLALHYIQQLPVSGRLLSACLPISDTVLHDVDSVMFRPIQSSRWRGYSVVDIARLALFRSRQPMGPITSGHCLRAGSHRGENSSRKAIATSMTSTQTLSPWRFSVRGTETGTESPVGLHTRAENARASDIHTMRD